MLARKIFQLIFNLLKRCFDISPTSGADFISTTGEERFPLQIKAVAVLQPCFISMTEARDTHLNQKYSRVGVIDLLIKETE